MRLSTQEVLLVPALFCSAAAAVPTNAAAAALTTLLPRANPTDAWITVDDSGHPKTIQPQLTTVSGTPTLISGAPYEVTGTLFTQTIQADVTTSTGDPPMPTATDADGAGSFPMCHNKDGLYAPFCLPAPAANLYPGTTYYVTWDPTFFSSPNMTVKFIGNFFNDTTGAVQTQAYASDSIAVGWSFYAWTVDSSLLNRNISLSLVALQPGATSMSSFRGPIVFVTNPPAYRQPPTPVPVGPALYIGLPTILGFVAILLVGGCIWNRRSRRIGLGNIMGRSRHGYGIGKSRTQRVAASRSREQKAQGIQLMGLERQASAQEQYRDELTTRQPAATPEKASQHKVSRAENDAAGFDWARRDSDALGSLAGTPTEERHVDFGHQWQHGNAFRDELSRQERERH